jgi:hypothetical protein
MILRGIDCVSREMEADMIAEPCIVGRLPSSFRISRPNPNRKHSRISLRSRRRKLGNG